MTAAKTRVVIVGSGFGGLEAARTLRHADVDITVIDKEFPAQRAGGGRRERG